MLPDNLHIVWWWRNQIFSLCDHHRFILFHSNLCLENMIWFSLTLLFGQCIWLQPAPVTSRLVYTIVCISKYPIEFVKKKKIIPNNSKKNFNVNGTPPTDKSVITVCTVCLDVTSIVPDVYPLSCQSGLGNNCPNIINYCNFNNNLGENQLVMTWYASVMEG